MKLVIVTLISLLSFRSFGAGSLLKCSWPNPEGGVFAFEFTMDKSKQTASAILVDGISPGVPAEYNCLMQESIPSLPAENLICTGPQILPPSAGQIVINVLIDVQNRQASMQNVMIKNNDLHAISSKPAVQCN